MKVEAKKAAPTRKMQGGEVTQKPMAQPGRFVAPIRGLIFNEPLSEAQPGGARVLDNWICGLSTIRPRKGYTKYATIATDHVESLFSYKTGASEKFFGASDDSIFEITNPASTTVIPTADVSGQTSGLWFTEQFTTAGGDYLYCVNGVDSPQLYDGSTWTTITGVSSPAITGVTTSTLSHVWSFANRLFFVEKNTLDAWYLAVDSIGGAASQFSLGGVFKRGGSLLFGATWSADGGDGPSERCVFISTEGEVAVYRGTNPGSAADWAIAGLYEIGKPLGPKAIVKSAGDLLVATEIGLISLTEAARRGVTGLADSAASRRIEPLWQQSAQIYSSVDWQIANWTSESLFIVSQPELLVENGYALVVNAQTGAWSRFTNMDMQSVGLFGDDAYFGTSDGVVYKMETTGADDGTPYTAVYLGQFETLGMPGLQKTVLQARPTFASNTPINPQMSVKVNYNQTLSAAPSAAVFTTTEGWGLSTWDTSTWDALGTEGIGAEDSRWRAIGATGYTHAPEVQMTFGSPTPSSVEYIGAEITLNAGALVA